jgi:cytosine deaminase
MDLIVREARVRGTEGTVDIGIEGDRIAKIGPKLGSKAEREIPADGRLVISSFVNPHMHLDKCMVRDLMPPNSTFAFDESIELTWAFKRDSTIDDICKRAIGVAEQAVASGTTFMRVFADVDTIGGLKPVQAMVAVREKVKDILDIQVVAFPQEGIVRNPGSEELMYKAMEAGADVVGGLAWWEHRDEDAQKHIDICFDVAKKFNRNIHMLLDNSADATSRTLEMLALKTLKEGGGRHVAASHCESLAFYNDVHAAKVIELVRRAGMSIVSNAHLSLAFTAVVTAREPATRNITRVRELLRAGVNVASGQDDVNDPYYPFGRCDQLEVAWVMAHTAQLVFPRDIETALEIVTTNAARVMSLTDYGLAEGKRADLVVLDAPNAKEAIRLQSDRLWVVRKGQLVAETKRTAKVHRRKS